MLTYLLPSFYLYTYVLAFPFPFTTHSLLLLCDGNSFDIFHVVGSVKDSMCRSKSIHFTSESKICSSYLELRGHWLHSVELVPFKGWPLCFVEISCWSLSTSKSQNLYYDWVHLLTMAGKVKKTFLNFLSHLHSRFSSFLCFFTTAIGWSFSLCMFLWISQGYAFSPLTSPTTNSPIGEQIWFLYVLMTQSLILPTSSPTVQIKKSPLISLITFRG